jgi:hypothetical protein
MDMSRENLGGSKMELEVDIYGRWTRLKNQKDINNEYGVNVKSFTT